LIRYDQRRLWLSGKVMHISKMHIQEEKKLPAN
jgi:hypothetical protein